MQTTKWSTSPKIPDFQNGGKSPWRPFTYVASKFKCLQFIYHWKGNFIRINIVLKTRIQKRTYFELSIDRNLNGHILKSCRFFIENCQDMKKWLNKITTIV